MSTIRKLYFFDKKKTEEMISFLNNNGDSYINNLMFNPLIIFHHLLPLKLKFLPESYVLQDFEKIRGLVTIAPNGSPQRKMEIQKLLFEENSYEDAGELIQYVVSKYKAMGTFSVLIKVDDYLPNLLKMLVTKCGFTQISYEKLWRIGEVRRKIYDKCTFRSFRNSDANALADLYNDSLLPHIKPLLNKQSNEFKECLFKGMTYYTEYKYVIEDNSTKKILGCISIYTTDNRNYTVDIIQTSWVELDFDSILNFAYDMVQKRNKRFAIFIRTKRYTNFGEKYENMFKEAGYECVQNKILLTNSSAKILKENVSSGKYTVIGDFCKSKIMPITKNI